MKVTAAVKDEEDGYQTRQISRILLGRTNLDNSGNFGPRISMSDSIRIDLDGRQILHLVGPNRINSNTGYPVIVQADLMRLFRSRLLNYGFSLAIALLAVNALLASFFPPVDKNMPVLVPNNIIPIVIT